MLFFLLSVSRPCLTLVIYVSARLYIENGEIIRNLTDIYILLRYLLYELNIWFQSEYQTKGYAN